MSAVLLARATVGEPRPGTLPLRTRLSVSFLAGIFPDIDFLVWLFNRQKYLVVHRGLTHSLVMWPLWTVLLALVCSWWYHGRYSWRAFVPVIAMSIVAHIAGDIMTAFGTMIFAPISDIRVSLPTTFEIDGYFTGIVVAGLAVSAVFRRSALPAILALAGLAGYVGFQNGLREQVQQWGIGYARNHGWTPAEVMAVPQPLSPFNWLVIVDQASDYRVAYVNLLRHRAHATPAGAGFFKRLDRAYRPLTSPDWQTILPFPGSSTQRPFIHLAWQAREFRPYRHFSLFPVAMGEIRQHGRR